MIIPFLKRSILSKINVINHTDNPIIKGVTIYKTDSSSLPNELRNRESLYDLETIKNETIKNE